MIYDTDNQSALRGDFLRGLKELVPYQKAFFDLGDNQGNRHVFFDPVAVGMTDTNLNDYYSHFESLDYAVWALSQDAPLAYRDTDLVSNEFRKNSLFCREWLRPMGVFFCGGTCVAEKGILYGSVTLMRGEELGDFSDREILIFDILNKHLCRRFRQISPRGNRALLLPQNGLTMKYRLTQREYEIIQLISAGLHNSEISSRLCISDNTTKKHISNIFEKLNVTTRSQLVRIFCEK